ncbi:MAG: D-alanyl-D-alanine carboxypeptidase, partial [Myxococcota bacterium]
MITVLIAGVAAAMPLSKAVDRALEADDALVGASIGLEVVDGAGEVRVAVDPDRRLIPASITKWVTAAAAAETLSLDFRFETGIAATGYTEGDVLHGDLVVIGGGDPSLGDPEVGIVAADVAALLRGLGVSAVDGDVVVDASRFDGPPHGPGWMWDDLAFPYSPPYAAANVAHNLARPGVGCAARGAPGSPVVDPPLCLGEVLRDGLAAAGVPVSGAAVVRSAPDAAAIGALRSAPLRDLLRTMLVESDNLYALGVQV